MQKCLLFHISLVFKLKCSLKLVENNVYQWYMKVTLSQNASALQQLIGGLTNDRNGTGN